MSDDIQKIESVASGQVAQNVHGDMVQTNIYQATSFKPLKFAKNIEIKSLSAVGTAKDFLSLAISSFIISIILTIYLHFNNLDMELDKVGFLIKFFWINIIFLIPSTIGILCARYLFPSTIILNNNSITIKNKKVISINYDEIRSIVKTDEFIGYSVYVYKENEIEPVIRLGFDFIHKPNAIYEFVNNKINSKENKKNLNKK